MSGQSIELGDVAAWLRNFEAGDRILLALAINDLTLNEAQQAVTQLLALASLALVGTGGRDPASWLTVLIDEQRHRPDLGSLP